MNKKKKNSIVGASIFFGTLAILILPGVIGRIDWNSVKKNIFNRKELKYENCVESCKANKVCIKKSENPTSLGIRPCAEYNTGDCINICTQKYK